jgi:photosystem II stability/assembly factor-like uncharacterized protein
VCVLCTPAVADDTVTPALIRQNLFSTCVVSDRDAWVVGELGRVLHTQDGGKTFMRANTDTKRGLLAVSCGPNRSIIVVGQHGLVMRLRNDGETWETIESGTKRSLLGIAFATPEIGVAVGDFGTIVRTEDGGTTWQAIPMPEHVELPPDIVEVTSPGDVLLYDLAFTSATHGIAVGEFGTIFVTDDAGKTWTSIKSPVEGTLFGVGFTDAQRGWAVGLESIMISTTDGGATWMRQEIPAPKGFFLSLYDVVVQGQYGWAVGDRGLLMQSTDAGQTWKEVQVPIRLRGNWFRGLGLSPAGKGMIVGNRGFMLAVERDQFRELSAPPDAGQTVGGEG